METGKKKRKKTEKFGRKRKKSEKNFGSDTVSATPFPKSRYHIFLANQDLLLRSRICHVPRQQLGWFCTAPLPALLLAPPVLPIPLPALLLTSHDGIQFCTRAFTKFSHNDCMHISTIWETDFYPVRVLERVVFSLCGL